MTFLLGDSPYFYNTLDIGLFGLIGIVGVTTGPLIGRVADKLHPWFGVLFGLTGMLFSMAIDTAAATKSVGAIVVVAFLLDVFDFMQQISSATRYFAINPDARSRINAVFIIAEFIGQFIGTAVGTKIYTTYGNSANGGMNMAWMGLAMMILLIRGPTATTWLGWTGPREGWRRQQEPDTADRKSLAEVHDAVPLPPMVPIAVDEPVAEV